MSASRRSVSAHLVAGVVAVAALAIGPAPASASAGFGWCD